MAQIDIEGWFFIPHSYAIVNQFQCLEMLNRPDIQLSFRDLPFYNLEWKTSTGLLPADAEQVLRAIPPPVADRRADATLRMSYPFDFAMSNSQRTLVFATCEFTSVSSNDVAHHDSLQKALADSDVSIITPSEWSKRGLVGSGADPRQVQVIPHGVDPEIFKPLSELERMELRRELEWDDDYFVFLNISTMTPNKGVYAMLNALTTIARKYPRVRVIMKGLDSIYLSSSLFSKTAQRFSGADLSLLKQHIGYFGRERTFAEMAQLYQAADAYLSPYHGEAFNLPVLEAAACGLPVICTKGGPTDEFTDPEFALRINAESCPGIGPGGEPDFFLEPDHDHLVALMEKVIEDDEWRKQARLAGPVWVSGRYTWKHAVDKLLPVLLD